MNIFIALCVVASVSATSTLAGINISGFEWGISTNGSCDLLGATPPLSQLGGADGIAQMQHFVNDDGLNIFRLPVTWQYLINSNSDPGALIDDDNFNNYNMLVQGCLATGAYCIVDIHNYARFEGDIIGQGGPTDEQFAALWTQLALAYLTAPNIIYGIMNEPHDLDVPTWTATVQEAVTAIRAVDVTNHIILLPGTNYAAAGAFISSGSGGNLSTITNIDGTTTNLIFDVHQYLDAGLAGTQSDCASDHISGTFAPLANWLSSIGRQALLSETGGGTDPSCLIDVCAALTYIESSSAYLGFTTWAAGSFTATYNLTETPSLDANGAMTDQQLVSQCIVGSLAATGSGNATNSTSTSASNGTFLFGHGARKRRTPRALRSRKLL